MKSLSRLMLVAVVIAVATPVFSDVIVMNDGKRLSGLIVKNQPGDSTVTIRSSQGDLAIPRTKIKTIETEHTAVGHGHIADQYLQAGNAGKAAEAVEAGLKADPQNADLLEMKKQVEAAQGQKSAAKQQEDQAAVTRAISRAEDLMKQGKFQEAVEILRSVEPAESSPMITKYRTVAADVYSRWGAQRADAQDLPGAIERLQTAIRLDPANEFARAQLIKAFEGDPTKLDEIVQHYEGSTDPADQLKLADAYFKKKEYEKALPIFLKYANDPKFGDKVTKDRILLMFDMLHRKYADQGDFETAYQVYQDYLAYDPKGDTSPLFRYEYMIRRSQTDPNDLNARIQLAKFAQDSGMPETALEEYETILKVAPGNEAALAGLRGFADAAYEDAQSFYAEHQFVLARQKTRDIQTRFVMFPDLVKAAGELDARAEVEAAKAQENSQQQAVALALRGDDYYNQALSYLAAFTSSDRDQRVRVFSPKVEATKYLERALFAWKQALALDQSLGAPTSYDLNRKIADAYAKYAVLANPLPPRMPTRNVTRGNNSYGSN